MASHFSRCRFLLVVTLLAVAVPFATHAQVAKPTVNAGDTCCAITSINGNTGIVTAKVTATGSAFTFKVTDATLLRSLHVGQAVGADFTTKRVTVDGIGPCCAILTLDAPAGPTQIKPAVPAAAKPPAAAPASAALPAELGKHAYEIDGVDVVLLSVQRTSGDTVTVRWQYRNTTVQPKKVGESFGGMGSSEAFSLVWDAYLLDGRTRLAVQKDGAGGLMAARHGGGKVVTIAAKESVSTWARFAAPAISVKKITVVVPGAEPFEDVVLGFDPGNGFDPTNGIQPKPTSFDPDNGIRASGLAVRPYEINGVEVVLLSVQRTSGDTITVRWQYRNTTDQPKKVGESFGGMGSSEAFSLVWDAYILDGRTRLGVQKDASGALMAARHGSGKVVTVAAKETLSAWARFAAPPIAVTKITVVVPGVEPFENVVIAAAGGA
jgi:hypothetical protein